MTEEELKLKQEAEKSLDKRLGTYAYIRKQRANGNYPIKEIKEND